MAWCWFYATESKTQNLVNPMKILKLSELIGQEIVDLKFHYIPENEYGLQSFQSYIKLENGTIIDIPKFDDDDFLNLNQENLNYYSSMFNSGQTFSSNTSRALVIGQKIVDFFFVTMKMK